jgi:hypothetical protein
MDPATLPVTDGANITFNTAVCPGVTVVLTPAPLAVNPAPVTRTLEIVTFAFPVFVSVTPSELLLPTNTLPKSRLLVLALSDGVDAMPLPLVAIANGVLGALLASEIEPVTFPADVGANTTLNVALWPAAMLIGNARPEVLKPAPVTFALEIVRLALPPFCNVIVCELLEPIATAGKLALVGVAASCGCGVFGGGATGAALLPEGLDPATTPAQPLPIIHAASTTATRHFHVRFPSDLWFFIVWQV